MRPNFVAGMAVLMLLAGCSRYNYAPNPVHIPYISEKNDYTLELNAGHPDFVGFIEAEAAYNPFRNITVMGNTTFGGGSINGTFGSQEHNGKVRQIYAELATGGKFFLWKSGASLGIYGGGGAGQVYNQFQTAPYSRLDYNKIFIQPTLAYQGKIIRLGLGIRYAQVNFGKGTVDAGIPVDELKKVVKIEAESPFSIVETGAQIGLHFHRITISLSMLKGIMTKNRDLYAYGFNLSNVILGCNFQLSRGRKPAEIKHSAE